MRAFLAIPLEESVRRAAAASRQALAADGEGWRFVRDEGLHVTIRFLGEVDRSRLAACDGAWREAASGIGPVTLRVRGAAVVPAHRRPRVLRLGLEDESPRGSLARLADRIERAARACGFPPEDRPFDPHVTLARARRTGQVSVPRVGLAGDCGAFVATSLILFRSELGRGGSLYHEEASYPLTIEGEP